MAVEISCFADFSKFFYVFSVALIFKHCYFVFRSLFNGVHNCHFLILSNSQ